MDLILMSNGKMAGEPRPLQFGIEQIADQVKRTGVKRYLLIPYAVISSSYDDRVAMIQETFAQVGCEVEGIHQYDDPVKAIEQAEGILVSGGNTWILNKTLHDKGLITPLIKAVRDRGIPYIGWSAGTNIACPTIRTTNDMPIVTSVVLPSLALIPFQINAHYFDAKVSGHMGETRDERIGEFLTINPHEPVAGLPEGALIRVMDKRATYISSNDKPLKLFRYNQDAEQIASMSDISHLL